jgi:hypothetical protein
MRFQKQEKNGFNLKGKGEKMIQKEKFRSKMASKEKKPAVGIDYASRKITGKHRDTNRQSRNQKDYFSHRGHRGHRVFFIKISSLCLCGEKIFCRKMARFYD